MHPGPHTHARLQAGSACPLLLPLSLLLLLVMALQHPARSFGIPSVARPSARAALRRPAPLPGPAQQQQRQQRRRGFRATPTCGLKVDIHIRGKRTGGEEWLNEAYSEYVKRLRPVLALETVWHKTDEELEAAVASFKAPVICLDERGKQLTSLEVASRLYEKLEEGGSRLAFVVGGAEGLPPSLKASRQHEFWSLSKLTFTHQWARVLLTEQLYRATEIRKGSGYHKE